MSYFRVRLVNAGLMVTPGAPILPTQSSQSAVAKKECFNVKVGMVAAVPLRKAGKYA